jgi:hypothetical protein
MRVQKAGQRQAEIGVKARNAGHAGRRERDAVIAAGPADDFLLPRPVQRVVVVPGELDRRFVGLGAGVGEEDLAHRRGRKREEAFPKFDGARMALMAEQVITRQLQELLVSCFRQPLLPETESDGPKARNRFDVTAPDADALAPDNRQRTLLSVTHQIRHGMKQRGAVACGQ